MAELKSGSRDLARTHLEAALQPGTVFSGSDEANKTLQDLSR
jgi:hypothetical protein